MGPRGPRLPRLHLGEHERDLDLDEEHEHDSGLGQDSWLWCKYCDIYYNFILKKRNRQVVYPTLKPHLIDVAMIGPKNNHNSK